MSLRNKILSGFLILVLMLAIAGIWSIYHFHFIGNGVNRMIDSEYESINSSISMLHALEREDSAILLSLLGNLQESSIILHSADSTFLDELEKTKQLDLDNNHSVLVKQIDERYNIYKKNWQNLKIIGSSEDLLESYFNNSHLDFIYVKRSVKDLLLESENKLYSTSTSLKDLANRATMPGIIAIIAALVFTIMFSYFVHLYFISPINKINSALKHYKDSNAPINVNIDSNDELAELAEGINYLSSKKTTKS